MTGVTGPAMLTKMTEEDWEITTCAVLLVVSGAGETS